MPRRRTLTGRKERECNRSLMNNARQRQKRTRDSSLEFESRCFKDDDRTAADNIFIKPEPEGNESNEPNFSEQNLSYDMSVKIEDIKEEIVMYSSWMIVGYNEGVTVKTEDFLNETGYDSALCSYNDTQEVISECDFKEEVMNHNDVKVDWEMYIQSNVVTGELKQNEDSNLLKSSPYYQCKFCEHKTKEKHYLMRHFRLKHDDKIELLQCYHCNYRTKVKYNMKVHLKRNHMVIRNADWLRCQYCDYRTMSDLKLKQHFKVKHNEDVEWHHCEVCEFKTKRKNNLKKHFTVKHDTEAKWYQCHLCDFRTKNRETLPRHLSVIHNKDAETYECHLCDFKLMHRRSLLTHLVMKHDENSEWHQCQSCSFRTKGEFDLARHIRARHDSKSKIISCQQCNYKTGRKSSLLAHFTANHIKEAI